MTIVVHTVPAEMPRAVAPGDMLRVLTRVSHKGGFFLTDGGLPRPPEDDGEAIVRPGEDQAAVIGPVEVGG